MKTAIFGGTGFVGSYLVDRFSDAGVDTRLLVRPGHEHRVERPDACETVAGDLASDGAIAGMLDGCDAAIYNVGILREQPGQGITFDELHYRAARRVMDIAERLGVRRFLLMSANGVKADGTAYQRTKHLAERHLQESSLDWTIIRPSVIFGDPRGRMEFATQLHDEIIASPLPAPLFYPGLSPFNAGSFEMSPVHVEDVAQAFVKVLQDASTIGQVLHLGGPESLSWRSILERIATAVGRDKAMLPVPALGVSTAAALFERFERFPITRDQIRMLLEGNSCDSDDLVRLGIIPRPFDAAGLAYLKPAQGGGSTWQQNAA
jgi:NADH dehydrogenase